MTSDRTTSDPLLEVDDLRVAFHTDAGLVRAVDGVSFSVGRGETTCLVGESGSGKSVTAEAITRLTPSPPGEIDGGTVRFDGEDVTRATDSRLRELRGNRIAHVFQDPASALNPVYTVGAQIREAIRAHRDVGKRAARARAIDLLDATGIPEPATRVDDYPHEFSGGMKQRVCIAIALACDPDLLIADEPTSALDATVEAGILDLFAELRAAFGTSLLFITHDLGVASRIADRVVVLYAGRVMESGPASAVFDRPAHPYTRALLACRPGVPGGSRPIPGSLPDPVDPPDGCRFAERCPHAIAACRDGEHPARHRVGDDDHHVSCIHYEGNEGTELGPPPGEGAAWPAWSTRAGGRDE
ncbi:ATP-binding cassette domain-containing protein [Halorubrum sp. JWXQ-INN 858]|uniref:ABC transporter ATP-binding protein n=1 Tax=Halorubrum sp. JWXQ-INN 858 TaxID=2690782 RepID=UPI001357827A|nr:ABC transporter ATP-binding protein [Halorubrum sp. JWXQ-INN 858]MWV64447.1 ATP-binding cassette domain-containing protein [Halorubrum sp. JWXQ-INN 858]